MGFLQRVASTFLRDLNKILLVFWQIPRHRENFPCEYDGNVSFTTVQGFLITRNRNIRDFIPFLKGNTETKSHKC